MPWQNGIWQHQAKAAIRMAERTAGRYGWHIAIIAAGSARDDGATRIELAKVRRWARATPPSGKASLKVARMIAGAQKTARPAWQANEPGGSAESFPFGSGGDVCVIRLTSNGTSLPEALATAFSTKAVDELAQFARRNGLTAADVAFWVSAHESAHCLLGAAMRSHAIDTAWSRQLTAPRTWIESQDAADHDTAVLARTEETAADLLASAWARQALPSRQAASLVRLVRRGRQLGSFYEEDDLHASSTALRSIAALRIGRNHTNPVLAAWRLAKADTRNTLETRGVRSVKARS